MASSLSVVIPTLNEEKDIPACLESVRKIASEIVVIDSRSTDHTVDIAKKFGAKIIKHKFVSFMDQRNYADTQTSCDWILSIEADAVVPKDLAEEIKTAIEKSDFDAFYIERINVIWGKPIMHTNWGPRDDNHIWLYKKGSGMWQGKVHEEYHCTGRVGQLKGRLFHHNYDTVSEFINKIDVYSGIALKTVLAINPLQCFLEFNKRYFYKLGFLDGYHGLFLSYLQSVYCISLYVKKRTS